MDLFLEPAGGAVVNFFNFETMAPAVAVFFHEWPIDGSSRDCRRVFGSSPSLGNF